MGSACEWGRYHGERIRSAGTDIHGVCDEILGTGTSDAGREHLGNDNILWRRESIRTNLDDMIVMGRLMRRDEM